MTGVIIRDNASFEKALRKFTEKVEKKAKPKVRRKLLSNVYG